MPGTNSAVAVGVKCPGVPYVFIIVGLRFKAPLNVGRIDLRRLRCSAQVYIVCRFLPWRSTVAARGHKSILYSNLMVLHGEFNPLNRMILGVKVKLIKSHVPGLVLCESSSLPNVPRAALADNRDGEASENNSFLC